MLPAGGSAAWWKTRLSAVRPFARWLQSLDPATQVPERGGFGRVQARATPYMYSAADIRALMYMAIMKVRTRTPYTVVGLISVSKRAHSHR